MFIKTLTIILVLPFIFGIPFAQATTYEAAQTDWSGGDGVTGPVTDWGDTFDSTTYVNWYDTPGSLGLTRVPITHLISESFDTPYSVYAADVDGDDDTDILGAASNDMFQGVIYWWENLGGSGTSWGEHVIDDAFGGAISVCAADMDDDGDTDVLGAASDAGDITWWENLDGTGTSWEKNVVDGQFRDAYSVYAADVDGDGDKDILGTACASNEITWWENDDGSGTSWTEHTVDASFDYASSVYAEDVDGDGDIDVLGTTLEVSDISWWSNDDGSGTSWTEYTVIDDFDCALDVEASDVDGDGDIDVISAGRYEDDIIWSENVDGSGTSWEGHTIDSSFGSASSICAADVDGDGDIDVLSASSSDDDITWWENLDAVGKSWAKRTVDSNFGGANSVYAADVDGDGKLDVLGAAELDDKIAWWAVTKFAHAGELVSSILDTGGSADWGQIDWTDNAPEGTTVKFQVRASNSWGIMGNWSGDITTHPFGLDGFLEDGLRYFQYKTILGTADTSMTPVLEDVTIDWGYTDIVVTSFSAESAGEGILVSWECADEVAGFNLYRSTGESRGKAIVPRDKLNAEIITGESPYTYLNTTVEESVTYNYWLEAIDVGGATETFGPANCTWNGALPTTYALYQSRPNPAPGNAIIAFDLPEDAKVTLTVYDVSGRKVTTVVNETLTVGEHEAEVSGLSPGVYVYRLDAGSFSAARKMVVTE